MSLMTPLLSRTLDLEEDEEVSLLTSGLRASGSTPAQGLEEAGTGAGKIFCDTDNCPGRGFNAAAICCFCEASVHMECFMLTVRKAAEYPEGCHSEVFCSSVCCIWHGNSNVDREAVRKERSELQSLLKKQLVEKARASQVRVTQRVNKKSLQVSKAMMIRRLMAKRFNELAGVADSVPVERAKPQKTVHARFRLINCIFSDELSAQSTMADNVDRSALDAGAVGDNSPFWKLCEDRFNNGFPVNSLDGPFFADTMHFNHPTIDSHHESVNPRIRAVFSSTDLVAMWKEIQKEYERVFTNFKKSGNHNSSFTREAMKAWFRADDAEEKSVDSSIKSADLDDVFGVEEGGFCNFTNSVVIIYLRLWLNEKPGLTNFVSRQLPEEIQIDSMGAPASTMAAKRQLSSNSESKLRKSPDMLAESINNLAKARKIDDGRKEMHSSITRFHDTETKKSVIAAKREEIQLLQTQIETLTRRYEQCTDPEKRNRYKQGLSELDDKLDALLMS